jgi:hypothetical protein
MTHNTSDLVKTCIELPHHRWLKGESFWALTYETCEARAPGSFDDAP